MRAELLDQQEELKNLVLNHTQQCLVVTTTTTLAYMLNSPIRAQAWDTILIDEVTMVPPAVCLYLSSLAQKRFLLAGDPRQLGPVYEQSYETDSEAEEWMGNDTYDFAKLSVGQGESRRIKVKDNRLVRITSQRRCIPEVWKPIQHLYPDVNIAVDESRVGHLRYFTPHIGQGVVITDTKQATGRAVCVKAFKSWQNRKSAELSVELAELVLDNAQLRGNSVSIALITPYRAQYKLLKHLLKTKGIQQQVEVGTIHQFQGSEADIVIFDLVDGPGRAGLGKLLRGDTGVRLVNVAISRARGKLIVLADVEWYRINMQREDNPILWDVVVKQNSP
jgi:superfamily I DNA and/or RNA helicase